MTGRAKFPGILGAVVIKMVDIDSEAGRQAVKQAEAEVARKEALRPHETTLNNISDRIGLGRTKDARSTKRPGE